MSERESQPKPPSAPEHVAPDASVLHRHWTERVRRGLRDDSWPRRLYDSVFLPVDPPTRFTENHDELVKRLTPRTADGSTDEDRTRDLLAEAQATFKSAEERIEGAERRATTLQSAVAIAASLLVAGGALLADPSKVRGDEWRIALAAFLVLTVVSLVVAGVRALGATSRIHVVHVPTPTNIIERMTTTAAEARIDLAAETLKDFGFNTKVADWKVAYLGAAAWWFRWALAFLIALAVTLGAYVMIETNAPKAKHRAVPGSQMVRRS